MDDLSGVAPFLDCVREHDLPLDFFSFHQYGRGIEEKLVGIRTALDHDARFATTEMHLNEYNSLVVDYPLGGPQEHHGAAAMLLEDFALLLAHPELTLVNWAQFMDSGHENYSGMVSIDGHRKAVFNAYKIYMTMPVDRKHVSVEGPAGLAGLASADAHTAALVVWNRTGAEQEVTACLHGLPFTSGVLRMARIDAHHASWGDDPSTECLLPDESTAPIAHGELSWSGSIPCDGVVYLETSDGSGATELAPHRAAQVVRTHHYYPDRTATAYADFDCTTWIARLGMAQDAHGVAVVGVTAEDLPAVLDVVMQVDGTPARLSAESLLGLRIDFHRGSGYVAGVLIHGSYQGGPILYSADRSPFFPWGTGRLPDRVECVDNLARFPIDLAAWAPQGWDGRAQITCVMEDTGPGTRAKIVLRRRLDAPRGQGGK